MKISDLRRDYVQQGLSRSDLSVEPFSLFEKWMQQAIDANLLDATAMVIATSSTTGKLSQRTVLLKDFDERGFTFFTNYSSQKSREMSEHDQVSLIFPWLSLERQVEIAGRVEKVSAKESADYFHSRPRESQIGAWASHQSSVLQTRKDLEEKVVELTAEFAGKDVPTPDFWGGWRVIPETIEFWQGRENRLHDRFEYQRAGDSWNLTRLSP